MGDPAFLVTRDTQVRQNPQAARMRLRVYGVPTTISQAMQDAAGQSATLVQISMRDVTIATDAVFMMIGNTAELLKGCKDAWDAGLSTVAASDGSSLSLYYDRIKVSWVQTDTVLMIGSIAGYWGGSRPFQSGWMEPLMGNYNISQACFFDEDETSMSRMNNIPEVLRWIKATHG